jgi:hypothetical protein
MSKKSTPKTLYRQITDAEKQADWYVELPDDRPTFGKRVSEEEWMPLYHALVWKRDDGVRILNSDNVYGDIIVVGSPEWKKWFLGYAKSLERRLFWEPRNSVGLTEETARLLGSGLVSDAVRRARRKASAASRARKRAAGVAARSRPEPSLW